LELFNKTNQFNTTGERYTLEQCHRRLLAGQTIYVIQAADRFTQYGLIGAAWVEQNCVNHVVMSCRALGLGIEDTLLAHIARQLAAQSPGIITARLQPTATNAACHSFFRRNGFVQLPNNPVRWSRPLAVPLAHPSHVSLTVAEDHPTPIPATNPKPGLDRQTSDTPASSESKVVMLAETV